ncbi:hypothetical protein FRB94_013935 [Tulasnella sp. JGI-2019a]|nr:hypothetical protein FRB94_013935 [Tulasnella sp. JGI-2019a]
MFIRSIQDIVFSQGRLRDDDWQADYASTCLEGAAMRWYCDLEDEPRCSWIHLRRGLLPRFPPLLAPDLLAVSPQIPLVHAPKYTRQNYYRLLDQLLGPVKHGDGKLSRFGFLIYHRL